jgi:hypothetical protein
MPRGKSIGTGLTSTLLSSQTTNTHRRARNCLLAASGATSLLYQVALRCQVRIRTQELQAVFPSITRKPFPAILFREIHPHRPAFGALRSLPARLASGLSTLPARSVLSRSRLLLVDAPDRHSRARQPRRFRRQMCSGVRQAGQLSRARPVPYRLQYLTWSASRSQVRSRTALPY